MSAPSTLPRVCLISDDSTAAHATAALLRACGQIDLLALEPSECPSRAREGKVDVVLFLGAVPMETVVRWISTLGGGVRFAALEGEPAAGAMGVSAVPGPRRGCALGGLVTRLNLLAAHARNRRRRHSRPLELGASCPAPDTLDLARGVDAILFLGSAGSPELLRRMLPTTRHLRCPLLLAVHHHPSQRTSFRALLTRAAGGPVGVFAGGVEGLSAGRYVVLAPVGGQDLGPDLDHLAESLVAEGARLLLCVGSGMGRSGVRGAAAVREAGGTVIGVHPDACMQPSMVQAAVAAGLVQAQMSPLELAALWQRVSRRGCVANDGARRSPAA